MSENVNDVYMSLKYDSIIITRLHILRIMTITLSIIILRIIVLKIRICIIIFIVMLKNGWNWMSIVNNTIVIKYIKGFSKIFFVKKVNITIGHVVRTVTMLDLGHGFKSRQ